MIIAVRYYSRGGNTKKLADAIAKAVGVEALTADTPLKEDVDILFLGSSVYAYGVDDEIKKFIAGIDVKIGKVVNFSTAALVKSTYKQVGKLLAQKNTPRQKKNSTAEDPSVSCTEAAPTKQTAKLPLNLQGKLFHNMMTHFVNVIKKQKYLSFVKISA